MLCENGTVLGQEGESAFLFRRDVDDGGVATSSMLCDSTLLIHASMMGSTTVS